MSNLKKNNWHIISICGVLAYTFMLYLPAINFPFIWDDIGQVVNNNTLRSWTNIYQILFSPTFDIGGGILAGAFYRPVVALINFLNYQVWGLYPAGFHILQLTVHVINVWLIYILVKLTLTKADVRYPTSLALIVVIIFASHPVNVESVVYIGSIGEVFYTLFILLAILLITKFDSVNHLFMPSLAGFFIFTFLGLLAKESAVVILIIAAVYFFLFKKLNFRQWAFYIIGSALTVGLYLWLRLIVANVPFVREYGSYISQAPIGDRLLTLPYILMSNLQTLIVPTQLLIYQNTVIKSWSDYRFWGYLLILLAIIFCVIYLIRKNSRHQKILFYSLAWYIFALAPVTNIVGLDMTLADRWLYFPAIGFWIFTVTLVALIMLKFPKKISYITLIIITMYASSLAVRTLVRQQNWQSAYSLYGHDIQYVQDSFELSNNYATTLIERGEYTKAVPHLKHSIELNPDWDISRINLGAAYHHLGKYKQAENQYLYVLSKFRTPFVYANLTALYIESEEYDKAQYFIDAGTQIFPSYNRLTFLQALLYTKQGNNEEARKIFEKLLAKKVINQDVVEIQDLIEQFTKKLNF